MSQLARLTKLLEWPFTVQQGDDAQPQRLKDVQEGLGCVSGPKT